MKKPAIRGGAKAGLSNAALAVSVERFSAEPQPLQVRTIAKRFGLSIAAASAFAELAFPVLENWRTRL